MKISTSLFPDTIFDSSTPIIHFDKNSFMMKVIRKTYVLATLFLMANLLFVTVSFGQAVGDYRSVASTNWNVLTTWQRLNALPNTWVTPTGAQGTPTSASGTITIQTGTAVPVTANVTVDQVVVSTGGSITINSGVTMTVANGGGTADLDVTGTVNVIGTLTCNNSTTKTVESGGLVNNSGTVTPGAGGGTFTFTSGATYQHSRNAGVVPAATWDPASNCNITGVTTTIPTTSGFQQTFGNFTWNCPGQTADLSFAGSLADNTDDGTSIQGDFSVISTGSPTVRILNLSISGAGTYTMPIAGDFIQSGGNLVMNGTNGGCQMTIAGNFNMTGGTLARGSGTGAINFNGTTTTQTFIKAAGVGTISGAIPFTINSGAIVDFGATNVLDGTTATFTVSSGGTLITANTNATGAINTTLANGSIQVGGTRTFNAGGNYTYNGTAPQNTGTGLPTNLTGILTINNNGSTVTLNNARIIANTGTVNLTNGTFIAGSSLTMASTSTINRSGGSMTGDPQGAGIYNVNYTANSKTTGSELNGTGLNNINENLNSGQTLTLGAAVTMDGTMTIASGTTLDVSGSNFPINIAGSWTNNSGTFTPGAGTVTFNGTGAQSINGTAASQTFNNVIINKTAATLLNTGGSTTTLTVNDLTETQGNLTSPATFNINGNFVHTAGTFTTGANTNIKGNWTRNGGTFTPGANTVTFTGSSAQLLGGSVTTAFGNLTINESGPSVTVTNDSLVNGTGPVFSVANNLTVTQGNLILKAFAGGPVAGSYSIAQNLTVSANGTLTHSVFWDTKGKQINVGASINITGVYAHTNVPRSHVQMTGTGTLSTGTSSLNILTLNAATVTASGNVTVDDNFWAMFNTGGSFTTNGQIVVANGGLLNAGGTVTVNLGGSLTVTNGISVGGGGANNGTFNISAGTVSTDNLTLGDSTGTLANTINQTGGTFTISGSVLIHQPAANVTNNWNINAATVTVPGSITFYKTETLSATRVERIVITTGTLNANGGINFVLPNLAVNQTPVPASKVIFMSGSSGVLNLKGALSGANLGTLTAGTSGSIFNYADNTTAQTVNFFGGGAYHNLHINTTGGTGAVLSAAVTATNVTGNLRVQSGTLNNGGFAIVGNAARTLEVANGATLQLAGTTSAFPTAFGTVSLGASSTVDYRGSGAQTVVAQNYGNLTVTATSSRTVTLANALTIGIAGAFTPATTLTTYVNTTSTVSFNGTTGAQNIPAFAFNNLTIANSSGVTLTGNVGVNGTTNALTFTSGKITTGANTITLASGVTVSGAGAGKYVFGKLAWTFPTGTPTRTFNIGDATNYTPVTVAFTTAITTGGDLIASTSAGDHASIGTSGLNASRSVNRTWTLTNTTISPVSYSATFNFIGPTPGLGDIDAGVTTANLIIKRFSGGSWFPTGTGAALATSTQATVITGFGDFQIAEVSPCVPPVINTPAVTNVSCNGGSDGAINITTTGGTTPFTYLWSDGETTEDASGLVEGDYSLLITATGGCTVSSGIIHVSQPAVLNAVVTPVNPDCNGAANGSISITSATGGSGGYEFTINGGSSWQSSGSFTSLAASTYNVQIRDAAHNSCVITLNGALTLTEPAVLNAIATPTDASCGNNDGAIHFTSSTGGSGSYQYTINGGGNWQSSPDFTGLAAGNYNVQIRDANHTTCVVILDLALVINQQSVPDAPTSGGNQSVCFNGDEEQTITATATSSGTITWFDASSGGNIVSPPSLTGVGTVTYYAEASSGACTSSTRTAVTLTISDAPIAPVSGGDETVCSNGDPMQTLIATATSPATITWWDAPTGGNNVTPALIGIGTITYYAEASNGTCSSPGRTPVTLRINPVLATPGVITGPLDACPFIGSPTPSTYSIDPVPGATFYTWHVPVGTTIVSGQGTTSIDVTFDNTFALTNSRFRVTAESLTACTSGESILEVLKIVPGIPTVINGPTDVCQYVGQAINAVYSVDPVPNATSYTWVASPNEVIVSGQGSTSIVVSFLSTFTTGGLKVTANSNCGNRAPRSLNISRTLPAAPGLITGPTDACPFIGTSTPVNYTIDAVPGAVSYTWTIPATLTLVSGQGTTSITVTFNSGYTTSVLKVKTVANCGSSTDRTLSITALAAGTPGNISGPVNACPFIGTPNLATYSIAPVANAASYNWTVPAGASITSHPAGAGINDTIITVSFNSGFVSGTNISVQAVACLPGAAHTLSVSRNLVATPGLITGSTNVCPFMVSGTNPSGIPVAYTIRKVANAASYTWVAPPGSSITAHPAGSGVNDTTVEITYSAGFVSGSLTVNGVNDCGAGGLRALAITRLTPGTPGAIVIVNTGACPTRQYTYTLPAMPSNATSILWAVPAGGTILSGQGTTSITVSYTTSAIVGTVTATAYNNCSNSATRSTNINLPVCGGFAGKSTPVAPVIPSVEGMQVNVSPNPTVSDFKLRVLTSGKEVIRVRILDMEGREYKHTTVMPYQTISIGADLKAGSYLVEVIQGTKREIQKLLKF